MPRAAELPLRSDYAPAATAFAFVCDVGTWLHALAPARAPLAERFAVRCALGAGLFYVWKRRGLEWD
mgnify:CR=1 FL=1